MLHRDLGFFFSGVVVIYAVSGLAVNHLDHWNPDFMIERRAVVLEIPGQREQVDERAVRLALGGIDQHGEYRAFDFPSPERLKVYLDDGSVMLRLRDGVGEYETVRRRPLLYGLNRLHLDPTGWWRAFADIFSACLILIVLTGVLLRRGARGILGRGKWLITAGMALPLLGLLLAS